MTLLGIYAYFDHKQAANFEGANANISQLLETAYLFLT